MISYNPKEWLSFIFYFHKGDTFRKLFWIMILIALYSAGIALSGIGVLEAVCQ
jgi:putative membrane protein